MNRKVAHRRQCRTSTSSIPSAQHFPPRRQPSTIPSTSYCPSINFFFNPSNIVGGHKANLNNPNTSEESKQHSRDVLNIEFNGGDVESFPDQGENPNNV
jgi:hypothetical protein